MKASINTTQLISETYYGMIDHHIPFQLLLCLLEFAPHLHMPKHNNKSKNKKPWRVVYSQFLSTFHYLSLTSQHPGIWKLKVLPWKWHFHCHNSLWTFQFLHFFTYATCVTFDSLVPHKTFLLDSITPHSLGFLLPHLDSLLFFFLNLKTLFYPCLYVHVYSDSKQILFNHLLYSKNWVYLVNKAVMCSDRSLQRMQT